MAELVRRRQTKGPETDRPRLNHRATPLLNFDARRGRRATGRMTAVGRVLGNDQLPGPSVGGDADAEIVDHGKAGAAFAGPHMGVE